MVSGVTRLKSVLVLTYARQFDRTTMLGNVYPEIDLNVQNASNIRENPRLLLVSI